MKHFKRSFSVILLLFSFACSSSDDDKGGEVSLNNIIEFKVDETSLVRNPLSGWTLYDDANDYVSSASTYWSSVGSIADAYASIFYWRSRWSELEPEEGKYAWEHNANFKALIKGALDRGLKLAFCVYIDGQDNIYNGTPNFVREAGAEGYYGRRLWQPEGDLSNWTPYADDPIFQEKFGNFIKAFAKEFDDPTRVDFVDAYNLGWWGEGHHVGYKESKNKNRVFQWITDLYGSNFNNVILVTPFGTEMGFDVEKLQAIDKHDYIIRRNSLGSTWFRDAEIETVASLFPDMPFIAESAYWGCSTDDCTPWNGDPLYKDVYKSWIDNYNQVYNDAVASRANTLDLREAVEARGWTSRAKNLVESFIKNGGYRFTPIAIEIPKEIAPNQTITIKHTWRNSGHGMCPNNNKRWNYKYKVAFSFIDSENVEKQRVIVKDSDPSMWLKGKDISYSTKVDFDLAKGSYTLRIAVVDTSLDNEPGLNLAVQNAKYSDRWLEVTKVEVK